MHLADGRHGIIVSQIADDCEASVARDLVRRGGGVCTQVLAKVPPLENPSVTFVNSAASEIDHGASGAVDFDLIRDGKDTRSQSHRTY